ncbi:MAG: HD domain-containing protein [Planctomycetes bacterium]|nr:HD domain-containing protein [Planctomycetota bacterium]
MAKKFVADLRTGEAIDEVFLLRSKELKTTRAGAPYLQGDLVDKTGAIPARMWDATELLFLSLPDDGFVKVKGRVETYQGNLQVILKHITKADETGVRLSDFMPQTEKNVDKMMAELRRAAESVADPNLKKLLLAFLDDKDFVQRFRSAPAATQYHHAYLGGLLEHTLSLVNLGLRLLSDDYPMIRRDLIVTGLILHDIGKVRELAFPCGLPNDPRTFQYTDEGQLIGHLIIGASMVEEKARAIEGFPPELLNVLKHMILSHHGEYEFGSPKLPMTVEAVALHHIDNLDAKIHAFHKAIQEDKNPASNWTEFNRMFDRRLFKK